MTSILGTYPRPKGFNVEHRNRLVFRCPEKHCFYAITVKEEVVPKHKCPHPGGETRIHWTVGLTLVQEMFVHMDETMDKMMALPAGPERDEYKQYLKGVAWTIALFMRPHFETVEDVSREAAKRYKYRQAGEEYESPGIGSRRHERLPHPTYTKPPSDAEKQAVEAARTAAKAAPKGKQISDTEAAAIKNAAQMFSPEELAGVYGITVERVKQILAQ